MQTIDIQTLKTHQQLSELLKHMSESEQRIQITKKDKPVGWFVGNGFMDMMNTILDYIIEHQPALADTLALMLNKEALDIIEQGRKEWQAGERIPLAQALNQH